MVRLVPTVPVVLTVLLHPVTQECQEIQGLRRAQAILMVPTDQEDRMLRLLLGHLQVQLVRKGQVTRQDLEDPENRLSLAFRRVQPHRLLQSLQCPRLIL